MLKNTHTKRHRQQAGSSSMYTYKFVTRQIYSRTSFCLKHRFPSSLTNVYHCSQRISYSKQGSDEFELRWKGCSNHDKTILEQLNQRHNRAERVVNCVEVCVVDPEEQDLPTQFLLMQKNQLIGLQEGFERHCNVLSVFGFNREK